MKFLYRLWTQMFTLFFLTSLMKGAATLRAARGGATRGSPIHAGLRRAGVTLNAFNRHQRTTRNPVAHARAMRDYGLGRGRKPAFLRNL